jgi:hypothetical protein
VRAHDEASDILARQEYGDDRDNVVVRGQDGRRSNARESVIFLSRASKQHELALGHSPGGSGRG